MDKLQKIQQDIRKLYADIDYICDAPEYVGAEEIEALDYLYAKIGKLEQEKQELIRKRKETQRLRELDTIAMRARFSRLR